MQCPRPRSGPRGKRKQMQIPKRQRPHQRQRLLKLRVRLARETLPSHPRPASAPALLPPRSASRPSPHSARAGIADASAATPHPTPTAAADAHAAPAVAPPNSAHQPNQLRHPSPSAQSSSVAAAPAPSPQKSAAPDRPESRALKSWVPHSFCVLQPERVGDHDPFSRSHPHRPRLIPENTNSLPPASTNPRTCRKTDAAAKLRDATPRLRNHAERAAIPAPFLNLQIRPRLRTGHAPAPLQETNAQSRHRPAPPAQHWTPAVKPRPPCPPAAPHRAPASAPAQSPAPGPCGCCPPPRSRHPAPPAPLERAAHSSPSPQSAPQGSPAAPAG